MRGYEPGRRRTPSSIAWALESEAVEHGWIVGKFIGSERDLIERFGASRDTVREAVRLLELRGSVVMERGRRGGSGLERERTRNIPRRLGV